MQWESCLASEKLAAAVVTKRPHEARTTAAGGDCSTSKHGAACSLEMAGNGSGAGRLTALGECHYVFERQFGFFRLPTLVECQCEAWPGSTEPVLKWSYVDSCMRHPAASIVPTHSSGSPRRCGCACMQARPLACLCTHAQRARGLLSVGLCCCCTYSTQHQHHNALS